MHYLGFDLETGGFDKKKHTITEAYFAIWSEDWELIDELHLFLKDDNGEVHGEEEAFKVTGIDPVEHLANPNTVTYSEGRIMLLNMLEKHKIPKKRVHYRPLGQNIIYFDTPFMNEQGFLTEEQAKKAGISHNALDTTPIVTWLKQKDVGILPSDVGSISSLVKYFELEQKTAHRAKDDVHMQKDIYLKLCELMRNAMRANLSSDSDSDLLKIVEL